MPIEFTHPVQLGEHCGIRYGLENLWQASGEAALNTRLSNRCHAAGGGASNGSSVGRQTRFSATGLQTDEVPPRRHSAERFFCVAMQRIARVRGDRVIQLYAADPVALAFQAAKRGGNRAQRAESSCLNEVVRTKLVDVATSSVHLQGNRAETGRLAACPLSLPVRPAAASRPSANLLRPTLRADWLPSGHCAVRRERASR